MDFILFQFINNLAGRWAALDLFGIFCAQYLIFVMAFAIGSLVLIYKDKAQKESHLKLAIKAFTAGILGHILKFVIQLFYARPRPFLSHEVSQLIDRLDSSSFPSGHVTIAFALSFTIYFYNKKLGAIFLALAVMVGFGRIYVGVHYPLDVLGGVLLGGFSAFIVKKYLPSFNTIHNLFKKAKKS